MTSEYRTANLSLAGYFAQEGYLPSKILKTGEMKSRNGSVYAFCYTEEDSAQIAELERKFYSDKALVNPKSYEYQKKMLKEQIDQQEQLSKRDGGY